jgi:DeoR family transcriptional regulator, deoxyribose operon repressor
MLYKRDERVKNIKNILQQKGRATVKEIASMLKVSDMTVRRDLIKIEEEGFIKRIHGGAILSSSLFITGDDSYLISKESIRNISQKKQIGIKAASLVKKNKTYFFDSGSTIPFAVKYIDKDIPITAVCYTIHNAIEFFKRKNTNLVLSGGFFHRDSNIFHTLEGPNLIRNLRADIAFISAGGVHQELGLTTYFYFEADIKRAMIESARQRVLLVDSSKFGKISVTSFSSLDQINTIITDDGISSEYKKIIQSKGIELIIA